MLTDTEARDMIVLLLTAPTDRDRQQRVGASNLSNGCDFCLASNLLGDFRDTPMLDRAYGGRVIGTAIHELLEKRIKERTVKPFVDLYPDAVPEYRMGLGVLGSYGPIFSTTDLILPSHNQAFDHKGSTIQKVCLLQDFLEMKQGRDPLYGRTHAKVKLSQKEYDAELAKLEYKITGYYAQACLYGRGLNMVGFDIQRVTLNFIARDHSMWFDNPSQDRYTDPKATKGVFSLGFNYSAEYATAMWVRAERIWEALEAGKAPADFASAEACFPCGLDRTSAAPEGDGVVLLPVGVAA